MAAVYSKAHAACSNTLLKLCVKGKYCITVILPAVSAFISTSIAYSAYILSPALPLKPASMLTAFSSDTSTDSSLASSLTL